MNNPQNTPDRLDRSAVAWFDDLALAAESARIRRDQARLAFRAAWLPSRPVHDGLGPILNRPTLVAASSHRGALSSAFSAATETYREVVTWFARSAALALSTVADPAAGALTADRLERHIFQSRLGEPEAWAGSRPAVPRPYEVRIGVEHWDRQILAAYEPLAAAYAAADEADDWDDRLELADWEVALADDAKTRAQPLWDLLHEWAAVVANAAKDGRGAFVDQPVPSEVSGE